MTMATASFTTSPHADDPDRTVTLECGPFGPINLPYNKSAPLFTTWWQLTDIVKVYASLQQVSGEATTLTLYKKSGTGTAGLIATGTAMNTAITLTATDFTAGQLHDCAEMLTTAELTGLPAGTIVGATLSNNDNSDLKSLKLTFVLREGGYRTTDSGGKFYVSRNAGSF